MSSNSSTAADTTTSGLTTDTGRSNPPGRTGGRGRGRGGRGGGRGHARSTASRPRSSGFKGTTPEKNGNVFECYDEQTDRRQYMKTLEALEGYAKKTLKYAEDLSPLFASEMKLPVLEKPARPGEEADETDIAIWNEDVRDYAKRKRVLRGNLAAIHAVIWGQCSESMKAKVKSLDGYADSVANDNCEWLLNNIKAVTMQFDAKHNGYISMLDATASFLTAGSSRVRAQTITWRL
ncbi:hypothetical protein MHU86_21919 [Fragilaria crotonensis]|nr:hypothetical protein MHU86_21919 [Fragilaria crotonensis]